MITKFKNKIKELIGTTAIQEQLIGMEKQNAELLKASVFNSTIADSNWLKYKNFSPGGWAVDYAVLYTLYRVLNDMKPKSILEFGLGQSSKMIHQYVNYYKGIEAITCEHDAGWVDFFKEGLENRYNVNIKMLELEEIEYKGEKTLSYKNMDREFTDEKFDLIMLDGPFGSDRYSRSQILNLARNNIQYGTFCIIMDDYERPGERETVAELINILGKKQVKYNWSIYSGSKQHFLLCSENLKFLTTM